MNAWLILLAVVVAVVTSLFTNVTIGWVQELDFGMHFKPKKQRRVEKCSKCGKRIKRGERVGCVVDYHGNTEWYCEECDKTVWSDCPHIAPFDE